MRVYGNLMNRVAETVKPQTPVTGMGATLLLHSDRRACTIVSVLTPKKIIIQEDKAIRTDKNGMSESQEYRYEADPRGWSHTATLRKNGTFVLDGESMRSGTIVRVGVRDHYHDYSF